MIRKFYRFLAGCMAAVVLAALAFFAASMVGAFIPGGNTRLAEGSGKERIYLLSTWLHTDFAIAADAALRRRFAFLEETAGMPIGDPRVKFLVFGWGSHAFYTTAKTYADIRPGPTLRAITGDIAVMHVLPAGDISSLANAHAIDLPAGGLARLINYIENSFLGGSQAPAYLPGRGYGLGDEFYLAQGHFSLLTPCNDWTAKGLRHAGIATGAWTPTTFSLLSSVRWHSGSSISRPAN